MPATSSAPLPHTAGRSGLPCGEVVHSLPCALGRVVVGSVRLTGKQGEGKKPPNVRLVLEGHDNDEKKDKTKTDTVLVSIT